MQNMSEVIKTAIDTIAEEREGIVSDPPVTYLSFREGWKTGSPTTTAPLTLCDPLTQIARRIKAFFKDDKDVIVAANINNNVVVEAGQDHVAEVCIYVQCGEDIDDTRKADCISNWIRHRHVIPEYGFDGSLLRNHILNVRVFAVGAIDPNDPAQTANPERLSECVFITDETEQYGSGSNERWASKYAQLERAFKGNPAVAKMFSYKTVTGTVWGFIECSRNALVFQEDNLTQIGGYKSELAADLLPLIFVFNGEFQIATHVASI